MTDIRTNILGRYSSSEVKEILEENRIMTMRWTIFENLYDKERQITEKIRFSAIENTELRRQIDTMESGLAETTRLYECSQEIITGMSIQNAVLLDEIDQLQNVISELKEKPASVVNPFIEELIEMNVVE